MSMEALSTLVTKPETIIKIHLARFGIKWHGCECNRFLTPNLTIKYAEPGGIVIVEFQSTNIVLIFEINEQGHVLAYYIPQRESDRLLLGIRSYYQEDAVVVCVQLHPIIKGRENAFTPDQVQHCKEVVEIIKSLVQRAKDGDFEKRENLIVFFAFDSDNKHAIQAKGDCKNGKWTTVTKHRPRLDTVGNGTTKSPRRVLFISKPRITRATSK